MWANVQRDGRPTEYRWHPLFNAAKFGWRPLLECRTVTLPIRETSWNSLGCPKLMNWSQPLVGWSSPYCKDIILLFKKFFPIVDTCLSSINQSINLFVNLSVSQSKEKILPDKVVRWCADGKFWAIFCALYFRQPRVARFRPGACWNPRPIARIKTGHVNMRLLSVDGRDQSWICNAPMHSKFPLRPHHVWKYCMVDIQSATAENRRGKKERRRR